MRCPLTAFETRLIFNLWKLVCGLERYLEFSGHKYNHTKKMLWLEKKHLLSFIQKFNCFVDTL